MKSARWILLFTAAAVLSGCAMNMLPSKDPWYAQHYFLMQKFEQDAYRAMSENGRLEFQKIFWAERAPAARAEFDRRLAYIDQTFRRENSAQPWNTDRARIYLLNGSPASIEYSQNDAWGMQGAGGGAAGGAAGINSRTNEDIQANTLEVWSYPYQQYLVAYAFNFQPPNKWKAVSMTAGGARYIGDLESMNRMGVWGPKDPDGYTRKLDELLAIK
ncbi:MAG: GWxTD domain-containing protein [Candidatus Aminicenantes bacterium]|nr:GWxTD domain-containing protein [Candidatus Aminicenantes bacterium]